MKRRWLIRFTRGVWVVYEAASREEAERKARELAEAWHYPSFEVVQLERDGGRVLAFLHYYVDSVEDGGLLGKHGYYVDPERCEVMEE